MFMKIVEIRFIIFNIIDLCICLNFFLVADSTVKRTTHNENASEFIVADSSVVTPSKNSSEFISLSEYPKLFIPKSLSVSDLTSDSMIMKEIRACSVPPSINFNVTPSENLQVDMDSQDRSSSHLHHSISDARIESESPSLLINLHSVTHFDPPATANFSNESDTDTFHSSSCSYAPSSSSSDEESHNQIATTSSASQNVFYGDVNEGRKRRKVRNMNEWKKNKNKRLRMEGKEYLGFTKARGRKMEHNKTRPCKQIGERCKSKFCEKSQNRLCNKITDECRQKIFSYFWNNLNWDQRKIYITGLINRTNVSRKTSDVSSRRKGTLHYFLPLDADSNNKVQVCRNMFLKTFCLGPFTIQSWVRKSELRMLPCQDIQNRLTIRTARRGAEEKMSNLNYFFDSIPKLPSHYRRKETTKLYLEPTYRSITDL